MSKYETVGGTVTRGETYSKILHLLDELTDQLHVMTHLHNTESTHTDRQMVLGWRAMAELITRAKHQITKLAMNKMQ